MKDSTVRLVLAEGQAGEGWEGSAHGVIPHGDQDGVHSVNIVNVALHRGRLRNAGYKSSVL